MPTNERPGVYVSYELSSISSAAKNAGVVGIAAYAASGTAGTKKQFTSYAGAVTEYGASSIMCHMIKAAFENGAETVIAVRVDGSSATYANAFALLAAEEKVKLLLCDSETLSVQQSMRTAITGATGRNAHKIGIVELDGTVQELTARAAELNSERMVLIAPALKEIGGTDASTGAASAAVAGAILAESDPALPLNGAELYGFGGVDTTYTDSEINTLVRGGVSVLETVAGVTTVVRAVTTRTTTGGTADTTWRELNTTLIIDDVIPTVRDSLRAKFTRCKNTAQTRGAIRSQVIMELESKLRAEIIDGYDNVTAAADTQDATVCCVSFDFTVAHGLNSIQLTAHITV